MTSETNPHGRNDPLLLTGRILTYLMQAAMALVALAATIAAPLVIVFRDTFNAELIAKHGDTITSFPAFQIVGILVVVLGIMALVFLFFGKLRAIIESVGDGNPFAPENADRLSAMGWLAIGGYALSAVAAGLAAGMADWIEQIDDAELNIDVGFDLTSILMIIILFILARVFRHGAAMRDDLEGTV